MSTDTTSNPQPTEFDFDAEPATAPPVRWRKTEIDLADLKCDVCGDPATHAHLVPYVTNCEHVALACMKHEPIPRGYHVELATYLNDGGNFAAHIMETKVNGADALGKLEDRLWQSTEIDPEGQN